MSRTTIDSRQITLRQFLDQIASLSAYSGIIDSKPANQSELDNLLNAINNQVSPLLRMSAAATPSLIVNVGGGDLTDSETNRRRAIPHIGSSYVQFTSGTVTLPAASGGSIVCSPGTSAILTIGSGNFCAILVYLDSLGNLNTITGSDSSVLATAITNIPPAPSKTLPIGFIVAQNIAGVIQAITQDNIAQFGTGAGGAEATGDGTVEPIPGYQWVEVDTFTELLSSPNVKVETTNYTNASFDIAKKLFRMSCDKTRTVTSYIALSTSLVVSGTPLFLSIGDIVYVTSGPAAGQWRRITGITGTTLTIDSAFSTAPIATNTLMLSQAVWTKDLASFGSATEKTRASDQFSDDITQIAVDYFDSLSLGDDVPDDVETARVVMSASNEGLLNAPGVPTSNTFTPIFTRIAKPGQINDYILATNTNQKRLHLAFFCNPNNGLVTTAANLLKYESSFFTETYITNGGTLDSAFCFSDGTGTPVNCTAATVVGGKTQVQLSWSYVPAVNSGKTKGQLSVFSDGLETPRYVAGVTTDAYYKEVQNLVTGVYDTIEFHADLSPVTRSLEFIKSEGIVDTSNENSAKISTVNEIVVGSAAQVAAGVANYSSIQTAINAATTGQKILILQGNYTEPTITINKRLTIFGKGSETIITGTITFTSGSTRSLVKFLTVTGNVTFNASSDDNIFNDSWQTEASTVTDNGTDNTYTLTGI